MGEGFGGRVLAGVLIGVLAGVLKKKSVTFFWGVLGRAALTSTISGSVTEKDFTTSSLTCQEVAYVEE